jgi:hypothetical protein
MIAAGQRALVFSLAGTLVCAASCGGGWHDQRVRSAAEREMTLGVVQKEIRVGLSQAEVVERLGSPNIVTRDAAGKETWVYDKVATEASYSTSQLYGTILILGAGQAAGAARSSQRTLTVVIKFDDQQRVESFSYHASKF